MVMVGGLGTFTVGYTYRMIGHTIDRYRYQVLILLLVK